MYIRPSDVHPPLSDVHSRPSDVHPPHYIRPSDMQRPGWLYRRACRSSRLPFDNLAEEKRHDITPSALGRSGAAGVVFLFAGGMKLVMPIEAMAG